MCGRFALISPTEAIREIFELIGELTLQPRYNIAPTQNALCVRPTSESTGRRGDLLRWGLIPCWAQDMKLGARMINARAETVWSKPAFRNAAKRQRCLVPADGFFEWAQDSDGHKQPYFFHLQSRRPMAFAGVWERWEKGPEVVESFTIITTEANSTVCPIHPRMPVILPVDRYDDWLAPQPSQDLAALLTPWSAEDLMCYPVDTRVNSPRFDEPACVAPLG